MSQVHTPMWLDCLEWNWDIFSNILCLLY